MKWIFFYPGTPEPHVQGSLFPIFECRSFGGKLITLRTKAITEGSPSSAWPVWGLKYSIPPFCVLWTVLWLISHFLISFFCKYPQIILQIFEIYKNICFCRCFSNNVPPDFEFRLEVYSHILQDDLTMASTPRKIKKTIHSSISRTVGKKLAATLKDELNAGKMWVNNYVKVRQSLKKKMRLFWLTLFKYLK